MRDVHATSAFDDKRDELTGIPSMSRGLISFAAYELDLENYELRRDGTAIELQPRVFDLLVYLVENHDRVVTRAELISTVWDGTVVSDGAITQAVAVLRRALGDRDGAPNLVETVRRRGYRLKLKAVPTYISARREP